MVLVLYSGPGYSGQRVKAKQKKWHHDLVAKREAAVKFSESPRSVPAFESDFVPPEPGVDT